MRTIAVTIRNAIPAVLRRAWKAVRPAPEVGLVLRRAAGERRLVTIYLALTAAGSALAAGKFVLLERLVHAATGDLPKAPWWLAATLGAWLLGEFVLLMASLCGLRLERRVSVALVLEALAGLLDPAWSDEASCKPETAVHLVRAGIKQSGQSLRALLGAATQGAMLAALCAVGLVMSPPLGSVCVVVLALAFWRTRAHLREQRDGARETFYGEQQLHAGLYQLFQALPQARLAGAATPYAKGLMEVVARRKHGERRLLAGQRRIGLDVQLLSAVCSLAMLLLGAALARWAAMPLATVGAMLLVQRSMLSACRQALTQWTLAHQPCEVVAALLRPAAEAERRQRHGEPAPRPIREIHFENARAAWAPDATPWRLTLAPGKLHGLVARGKGASLRWMSWLASGAAPIEGRLWIDDVDIRRIDRVDFRSRVLLGAWPPMLHEGSLAENLRIAAPGASDAELLEALRAAGLMSDFEHWQVLGGLETMLGPKGLKLSFGQQQRLLVARAWLRRADVTLLDDPMRGLDYASTECVLKTLREMARQRIVVLGASQPQAWRYCESHWLLHADGTLEEAVFNGRKLVVASAA